MQILDITKMREFLYDSISDYMKKMCISETDDVYIKTLKKFKNMSVYEILKLNKNEEKFRFADYLINNETNQIWCNIWK